MDVDVEDVYFQEMQEKTTYILPALDAHSLSEGTLDMPLLNILQVTSSHREQQKGRVVVLNYSSGTTGLPKGVEISHYNYIANAHQVSYVQALAPDFYDWQQRARGIAFLPMYHAYGQTFYGVNYPKIGVALYVMRKYDFITMLEWIQKYRITNLTLVPPIVVSLTKRKEVKDYDLGSLEGVGCGAAPLGKESILDFESKFATTRIAQGWGMTEVTCSAVTWDPTIEKADPSAVGELMPNLEGMVVDEEDKEVGVDQRGEFWVRGPNVMKGYWQKPEETRKTLTPDGWLKTGDVGFRDGDGYVHIVDRKKELIKVKGLQVAPAELEALLLDHPQVDDAAVVGVTMYVLSNTNSLIPRLTDFAATATKPLVRTSY